MSIQVNSDEIHIKSQMLSKIYNVDIDIILNLLKDITKAREAFKYLSSPALFIQGNDSSIIESEFCFPKWKYIVTLYYRTYYIEDTQNYKKIAFRVYNSKPKTMHYDHVYTLFRVTKDNSTLIIYEWIYNENGISAKIIEMEHIIRDRLLMLDLFAEYLINETTTKQS
jgi:hypothetical protein